MYANSVLITDDRKTIIGFSTMTIDEELNHRMQASPLGEATLSGNIFIPLSGNIIGETTLYAIPPII